MCAAGVRRSVLYQPVLSYSVVNRPLSRWLRRAANDNHPQTPSFRFALLLTGTALGCALFLFAALSQA